MANKKKPALPKRRSVEREMLIKRRLGTGGSGSHGPKTKRQRNKRDRKQSKQDIRSLRAPRRRNPRERTDEDMVFEVIPQGEAEKTPSGWPLGPHPYSMLEKLPAIAYLIPELFHTSYDELKSNVESAPEKYEKGKKVGQEYDDIFLSVKGVWSASTVKGGSLSSSEGIGYHAVTEPLLRGFLDSGAPIYVYRWKDDGTGYRKVQITGPGLNKEVFAREIMRALMSPDPLHQKIGGVVLQRSEPKIQVRVDELMTGEAPRYNPRRNPLKTSKELQKSINVRRARLPVALDVELETHGERPDGLPRGWNKERGIVYPLLLTEGYEQDFVVGMPKPYDPDPLWRARYAVPPFWNGKPLTTQQEWERWLWSTEWEFRDLELEPYQALERLSEKGVKRPTREQMRAVQQEPLIDAWRKQTAEWAADRVLKEASKRNPRIDDFPPNTIRRPSGDFNAKFQQAIASGDWEEDPSMRTLIYRARNNPRPKTLKAYDPREEQVRAQRQGIYESLVRRELGLKSSAPFRSPKGVRLDVSGVESGKLSPGALRDLSSRMFAIGTRVPQKYGRLREGTQRVAPRGISESRDRYENVDHLLRNRQDYEETLALVRGEFYRVVPEMTNSGVKHFVWPMPPGVHVPGPGVGLREAQAVAADLNKTSDPRSTGLWWQPPKKKYSKRELAAWLPPAKVWK